ncbi:MAG: D-alanine--D-alanine ligase [Clostridiales bacterium]|nr:D-alanine--D-alanine ligase [Clostridiales bacterium]
MDKFAEEAFHLKKNAAVLFGGCSSEYEVSLNSAYNVIRNMPEDYNVIWGGITRSGQWFRYEGDVERLPDDTWLEESACTPAFLSPDTAVHGLVVLRNPVEIIRLDVVFPVLHGKNGEDGTVQGLLELAGIPYVGCGMFSSAYCMDKEVTNTMADMAGIDQVDWTAFTAAAYRNDPEKTLDNVEDYLGYPMFVKPACAGSSVGVSKVRSRSELEQGVKTALNYDNKVVIEADAGDFHEVECAVLGNTELRTGVVGEILAGNEFYDYEAKYQNQDSKLLIPAGIGEALCAQVAGQARKVYRVLGCAGMARVDFFVRRGDNRILFNEINTIPGFTSISMYAKLMLAAGLTYPDLIGTLLDLAQAREEEENT